MKIYLLFFLIIAFVLTGCFPVTPYLTIEDPNSNEPEILSTPQVEAKTESTKTTQVTFQEGIAVSELAEDITWLPAGLPDQFWVTNPTSKAQLFVQIVHPDKWDGSALPALVLIPGGVGWGGNFIGPRKEAETLANRGFIVVVFDPDGRGRSEGVENWDGYIHQDGLMAVVQFAREQPAIQVENIALISFSYGVTMATGYLARYPENGIIFYIDWEGPVTRYDTTTSPQGECAVEASKNNWQPCDNDAWWAEREALTFISQVSVPAYQRVQSEQDHVQPDVTHAIQIVNQAVEAGVGWVRLNEYPVTATYDESNPPIMLDENLDRIKDKIIADYAEELLMLFGQ